MSRVTPLSRRLPLALRARFGFGSRVGGVGPGSRGGSSGGG